MSKPESLPALRAAAIEDDGRCDMDALLAGVAMRLRREGRQVRGLLMTYPQGRNSCAGAMVLVDIDSRREYLVSQPLGSGAQGCRADLQGFARASEVLRHALVAAPDLVISNRFGGLEVGGGGFRNELLELLSSEVPLLTVVASRHRAAWDEFTGGAAAVLPAEADAINAWLRWALDQTT